MRSCGTAFFILTISLSRSIVFIFLRQLTIPHMNFIAHINVMPKKEILDTQGKAVKLGLKNLGLNTVEDVRIGKHITMRLQADNEAQASEKVDDACSKLLANMIMESYDYTLETEAV